MILGIDLGETNIRIREIKDGRLIRKTTALNPSDMEPDNNKGFGKF